mgnify:CR=1 FL=1
MTNCRDCRFWNEHYFYDPKSNRSREDASWRAIEIQDAGFGCCNAIEKGPREKRYDLGSDIEYHKEQGAFVFSDYGSLITHQDFGCNRWQVRLGRKRKAAQVAPLRELTQ